MSLFDYVHSLRNFFHKDEIVEDLRINIKEYKEDLNRYVKNAAEFISHHGILSKEFKSLNYSFLTAVRGKDGFNVFEVISKDYTVINENMIFVKDLLQDKLSETSLNTGLSAQKAVAIRTSEQFSFFVDYLSKLLNYFYILESKGIVLNDIDSDPAIELTNVQVKEINGGLNEFCKAFLVISDAELKEKITKIPNLIVNTDGKENPALAVGNPMDIDPFNTTSLQNFIGNPIYHLRSIKTTYQANKYKLLQERKKLLELRLSLLKDSKDGKNNPFLEKKISDMQDYINGLEYKLKELEE